MITGLFLAVLAGFADIALSSDKVVVTISNCTKSTDEARVSTITLTPKSPVPTDHNFTLAATGTTHSEIASGTFQLVAKLGFITVLKEHADFCAPKTFKLPAGAGDLYYGGVKCPVAKGKKVEVAVTAMISSNVPSQRARKWRWRS